MVILENIQTLLKKLNTNSCLVFKQFLESKISIENALLNDS